MTRVTLAAHLLKDGFAKFPTAPRTMAHRRIVDTENQVWDVWEVNTSNASPRILVQPSLAGGWLAFQSGERRRRLAPPPPGWSDLTDEGLLDLMAGAESILPRSPRIRT